MKQKSINFIFLLIVAINVCGQDNKGCSWKSSISKNYIVINMDSSFSFTSAKDTAWLYSPNKKSTKFRKNKVLSVTDGSDIRKYKVYKKNDFLFLQVKVGSKILYYDTLANIINWQEIKGYTLGSDNYKLKDRLNYLDTAFVNDLLTSKDIRASYYVLYTTYLNVAKFTRWYIRKKDLVVEKMETCYKVSPLCPLSITRTK
jgi:hypothetical protein